MSFTPADFCIGESGIWFYSLLWEHGKNAEPVEFLDDRSILAGTMQPLEQAQITCISFSFFLQCMYGSNYLAGYLMKNETGVKKGLTTQKCSKTKMVT